MRRDAFRLLDARAQVLQQEGESRAAAMEWAKMYDYATSCADGGLLVHWLQGVAFENMALNGLRSVTDELSPEEKHEVLAMIEAADRESLDFAAILEREHAVVRSEYEALHGAFLIKATGANTKPAFPAAHESDERIATLIKDDFEFLFGGSEFQLHDSIELCGFRCDERGDVFRNRPVRPAVFKQPRDR